MEMCIRDRAVLAHEVGAHARQITFIAAGEALEQQRRNRQAQHGIAQEFKPFVVFGAPAAVGQRPLQQDRLSESITQAMLEGGQRAFHGRRCGYRDRPSYLIRM